MEKTRTPTMKNKKGSTLKLKEKKKMKSATCNVKFVGWRTNKSEDWDSWVEQMCSLYQSTWENAGIYEAIMSSTYTIKRQDNLVLEMASRWCSQTNTFAFPWGNATLTLEDMLILGGFSSSGVSALTSLDNDAKSRHIKEQLELARLEMSRTKSKAAYQGKWMEKFKESESELQHAAFLSLWLSRHVFPVNSCRFKSIINRHAFPVAARLCRGIKIALGPAVLAMLYRGLSLLAKRMCFTQLADNSGQTSLCSLLHLVQIWAWERFPMLKPVPNCMYFGENFPRLARWSNVKIRNEKDLQSAIDSAEKTFLWCPYDSSAKLEVRDQKYFGKCIEAIELIGFDSCVEKYQPQLVARQFGLNQDITSDNIGKDTRFTAIEVINVLDSDSDQDCSVAMTELLKLPIFETRSRTPLSSSIASPDVAVKDTISMDRSYADEKNNGDQLVQLQHSDMVSPPFDNISNEAMYCSSLQIEVGTSSDAESYMNQGSEISGSKLEARISRLEDRVYAHIKTLEASRQS